MTSGVAATAEEIRAMAAREEMAVEDALLPDTAQGLRRLVCRSMHRPPWLSDFVLHDFIQIVDLQVFTFPRITLEPLVSTFPCFANILVSLMEKPHVDFGLKAFGADLMDIPILYKFVQETIKKQVAIMYLWPKTLQVPIMDPSKLMGEFRDAVLLWISLIPYLGGAYFWVVSYTTWSTSFRFNSAPPPSSPPPSSSGACHRDELIANLDWSLGWEITLFLSAVLIFYYCRNLLDTAAAIEAKLSPDESEAYEAARAELKEAMAALKIAEPAARESKRKRRDAASLKVERSKLKEGLERLSMVGRIWLRFCYLLAIGLSLMAGLSAVLTYYYSLELRSGCKTGFAGIFPFFVVGPIFLFYHIQSLIVGYHAY